MTPDGPRPFKPWCLARLPSPDHAFGFVLTFTVLQHLTDRVAARHRADLPEARRQDVLALRR